MQNPNLPKVIQKHIKNMTYLKDTIGCSKESVYYFPNNGNILYLKIGNPNTEFENEQKILKWLQGRLPVPKIITTHKEDEYDYLLMSKAIGKMSCSEEYLKNPKLLVKLLAEGINMLQEIDISNCPFDSTLENKLNIAEKKITSNEIDIKAFKPTKKYKSPSELYDYLICNKPKEELVFSHGDYCLPNIFLNGTKVTGFIDVGRAGVADKWQDIALCIRSLRHNLKSEKYTDLFFEHLGIKPNYEKINYYILLDELF